MRELVAEEVSLVQGGVAPLVVGAVVVAVVAVAAIGTVAYGVSKGCSGSAEVTDKGVKVEVNCKA